MEKGKFGTSQKLRAPAHQARGQALMEFMLALVIVFTVGTILRSVMLSGRDKLWSFYITQTAPACTGCGQKITVGK